MKEIDCIYNIECIHCGSVFIKNLQFEKIEIVITCENCNKNSMITIGDVNSTVEVYRGSECKKMLKTKVIWRY